MKILRNHIHLIKRDLEEKKNFLQTMEIEPDKDNSDFEAFIAITTCDIAIHELEALLLTGEEMFELGVINEPI